MESLQLRSTAALQIAIDGGLNAGALARESRRRWRERAGDGDREQEMERETSRRVADGEIEREMEREERDRRR